MSHDTSRCCARRAPRIPSPTSTMVGTLSWLLCSLLVAGVHASVLTLQSPRFTIFASDASQLRSEPCVPATTRTRYPANVTDTCSISLAHKPSTAVTLGPTDSLKLTFQIVDENGKGVQPHQTFLRFYDPVTGEEGVQPVKVTPGGKAKFELVRLLAS